VVEESQADSDRRAGVPSEVADKLSERRTSKVAGASAWVRAIDRAGVISHVVHLGAPPDGVHAVLGALPCTILAAEQRLHEIDPRLGG
jgi:hypothetical protein